MSQQSINPLEGLKQPLKNRASTGPAAVAPTSSTDLTLLTCLLRQRLVEFALIEEPFFGLEMTGVNDPNLFPVRSVNTKNTGSGTADAQVEKPRLSGKPRRIRQQPNHEGIFERFFDFLQSQRAIEIERRVIPIKLHSSSIVYRSPMQCRYIVFTQVLDVCQTESGITCGK